MRMAGTTVTGRVAVVVVAVVVVWCVEAEAEKTLT